MLVAESLELYNVVSFKKARLDFKDSGITFVRGKNSDSDPLHPSGNGAGKSLLFSAIPNLIYSAIPSAIRKKSRKDILSKSGSKIVFSFTAHDGAKYVVSQTASKYTVFKDGIDLEIKRIPVAEKLIQQVFPIPQVEFYTTCFVSTQRPYPFQNDTDLERLEHLTVLFELDSYDALKAHFMTQLRLVKDNELKMSVLLQKRTTLSDKLKAAKAKLGEIDIKSLKARSSKLDTEIESARKTESELTVKIRDFSNLARIEEQLDELRASYKSKQSPKDRLSYLKTLRGKIAEYTSYVKELKAFNASIKSIEDELNSIELPDSSEKKLSDDLEQANVKLDSLKSKLGSLESKQEEYEATYSTTRKLKKKLASMDVEDPGSVDLEVDYNAKIEEYSSSLRLEKLLQHNHDGGKCPVCLSDVDFDAVAKVVKRAKEKLPQLKHAASVQEVVREYNTHIEALSSLSDYTESISDLKIKIGKLTSKIDSITEALDNISKYKKLKKRLASFDAPDVVEKPNTDLTAQEVDDEIELCSSILALLASKHTLIHSSPEMEGFKRASAVKKHIKDLEHMLQQAVTARTKASNERALVLEDVDAYTVANSEVSLYETELQEVKAEILVGKNSIQDKPILEALVKAYSSKGLKTIVANQVCGLLEQNLNHYRGWVFAEPFVFTVSASETGMSILVDRGNGHPPTDVRTFSGAESDCFRQLFPLALLPLIPDRRRTNFIVLDEPSSHSDEATRQIFVNSYLPALAEIVPNIFVITPHDDYVEGSAELLVQKRNGVSKVSATR